LASHPVQYQAPLFRALAARLDVHVFYAHRKRPEQQAAAGFGIPFEWDVDLLSGYPHTFLKNRAKSPSVCRFRGCDTPEIADHIRRARWDAFLVNGWHLKCYWQAIRACRRTGVPILVRGDSHLNRPVSGWRRWFKHTRRKMILRQFDGFLVVGKRTREFLEHHGVDHARMFDTPHCVDDAFFQRCLDEPGAIQRIQAIRAQAGANGGGLLLLFVGKLIPRKRPLDLLRATARLRDKQVSVVVVGDGPLRKELEREAGRRRLGMYFTGFKNQSELAFYYAAADALVLPSDGNETWGLVVNEAMACGVPAIVSDRVGCAPDLIEEGRTGFVYPVGNIEELTDRIERLSAHLQSGRSFGSAVRERIQAFSLQTAVAGTLEALKCVSRNGTGETTGS
jgi:glycosyltransferase involved in cell wall biosynthesis